MPTFEMQGPDGKTYEVEAPDMRAAASAFGAMSGPSVGDLSVRNVATAAARGVPVLGGLVDNAIAGGQALFGNGSYGENLKAEQDRNAAFDRDHPWVSGAAQLAGGVAGTIPMVMAAPAAFGAGAGSLAARAGISLLSGAGIGGADSAVRSGGDLAETAKGAGIGGFAGGVAPLAGRYAGEAANAAMDYLGRPTNAITGISQKAADYAADTLGTPIKQQAVGAKLQALGPDGMLADASPEWMAVARGAAARPGQRDLIVNALLNRDAGKNARLGANLDASLGRPVVPSQIGAQIEEGQKALGPAYGEAFRDAVAVDTQHIADRLDGVASILRGPAQKAVNQVRGMLNVPGTDALDPHPGALFQTRQAIDGLIASEANPKVIQQLEIARQEVDGALAQAVPGIKDIDAQFAELARQREALQRGSQVLDSGKTAVRPQELATEFPAGALPQGTQVGPSAVPFRMQQGTRAEIDRLVGQAANDPAKLQQVVRQEGDWNREKLRTVFGQQPADDALSAIDRETAFYRTKNRVENGSDTGMTNGFRQFLDAAATPNTIPVESTATGLLLRGAQKAFGAATQAAADKRAERFAGELGRLAVAQGGERDALVQALLDMVSRQQGRLPATKGTEMVVNALLRSGGLQVAQ
ncbi:hypothetical protein FHS55_002629 [Angulomicrobium tetraedrale]|uniref:Uncharacterized protein n=1 Tax=Ancylobacter tetraedralis TaxID=217068 RepID=A0A839ZB61_9HYPH|nr:hypothetical protein [Ancylobacter tetraedralis]MBB3772020.1 hypothetical protein [Ancylobacter tetraedralis]